jgi:hypothetical protein
MTQIVRKTAVGTGLARALLLSAPAVAGLVLAPVAVVNNELGQLNSDNYPISHVYDQTGLSSGYTGGVTDFATYIAGAPTHEYTVISTWLSSNGSTTGDIDFDLGATYTMTQLALWDRFSSSDDDINEFTVFASADSNFTTSTNVGTFNLGDPAGPLTARPVQLFDLSDSVGRYLRLRIVSNQGSSTYTGLGELALEVNAASTPEPASLMLCGLAGLVPAGSCLRHRLRKKAGAS